MGSSILDDLIAWQRRLDAMGPFPARLDVALDVYDRMRRDAVPAELEDYARAWPCRLPEIPVVIDDTLQPGEWRLLDGHGDVLRRSPEPK